MALPIERVCLVQDARGRPVVSTRPLPRPQQPFDVLVKVISVGLNHTDYKTPRLRAMPGAVLGCDFTGTVVAVHPEAPWASDKSEHSRLGEGTCVSGLVHGSNPLVPEGGAFSEYVLADGRFLLELPSTWSKLEKGALSGVAWTTVAMSMDCLQLAGRPSRPAPGPPPPVLVSGGATTTGTMACQILSRLVEGFD